MASSTIPARIVPTLEFNPLLRVYKSSCLERPLVPPPIESSLNPEPGVKSKDVMLRDYSGHIYLPPTSDGCKKLPIIMYIHLGGFVVACRVEPAGSTW
jgi:acetyl esterase/lipase